VLLHGKGGKPGSLAGLANKLQSEGMKVVIPTMAWSGHGGEPDEYGLTYENALQDIEGSIQNFKSRGLSKIVLAGHSLGANAAIAFGTNPNLYAIIALAPGHFPERMHGPDIQNKLDEARMKIAAGQGKSQTIFPDLNSGSHFQVRGNYLAWYSYFNPNGLANMSKTVTHIKAPLLLINGKDDPAGAQSKSSIFDRAPANGKNRYIEIDAGHFDVPEKAANFIITWLSSL
jgi:esterase/lipase